MEARNLTQMALSDNELHSVLDDAKVVANEGLSTENTAVTLCGGPSLFRTCRESLTKLGYKPEDIITTREARIKCGVGKCGRCNIGGRYICLDGPVFTEAELATIPRDL